MPACRRLICFSFCAYVYRQLSLNMFLPHLSCAFFSPNTRQADRTRSSFKATLRPVAPEGSRLLIRCSTMLLRGGGSGTGSFSSHCSTLVCKSTFPEKSCKIFFKFDLIELKDFIVLYFESGKNPFFYEKNVNTHEF